MQHRRLVIDANILIRAVLGRRVRETLISHAEDVDFFAPEVAFVGAFNVAGGCSSSLLNERPQVSTRVEPKNRLKSRCRGV